MIDHHVVIKTMCGELVYNSDGIMIACRDISTNEYNSARRNIDLEYINHYSGSLLGEEDYKIPFSPPDHEFSDAECEAARKELNGLLEDTT